MKPKETSTNGGITQLLAGAACLVMVCAAVGACIFTRNRGAADNTFMPTQREQGYLLFGKPRFIHANNGFLTREAPCRHSPKKTVDCETLPIREHHRSMVNERTVA